MPRLPAAPKKFPEIFSKSPGIIARFWRQFSIGIWGDHAGHPLPRAARLRVTHRWRCTPAQQRIGSKRRFATAEIPPKKTLPSRLSLSTKPMNRLSKWGALWQAQHRPSQSVTFGWRSAEPVEMLKKF